METNIAEKYPGLPETARTDPGTAGGSAGGIRRCGLKVGIPVLPARTAAYHGNGGFL